MPGAVCIASPSPTQLFWSPSATGSASGALPFPYSAGCQGAQALPKDVILFLQAIKPFTPQAASSLQLSHAWPRAISGLKKKKKPPTPTPLVFHWMQIKGSF